MVTGGIKKKERNAKRQRLFLQKTYLNRIPLRLDLEMYLKHLGECWIDIYIILMYFRGWYSVNFKELDYRYRGC